MEGGLADGVPGSPSLTPSPYPSSTPGTHPRPGASSAASNRMHLRTLIATSLSMVTTHPRGGTALAPQPRQVVRTHFRDEEKEVQTERGSSLSKVTQSVIFESRHDGL